MISKRSATPWRRIVLVLAAVGLVTATVGVVATSNDDAPAGSVAASESSTSTSTSEPDVSIGDLEGPARELAELLAEGRASTYHARYSGSSATGEGGALSLETWAERGRFRQDTVVDVAGQPFHRANFVLPGRGAACTKLGETPWSCEEVPATELEGTDLLGGSTLEQLRRASIGATDSAVDGRAARCFAITYDARTTELCVSPEGVPLRIRSQSSQLLVEELDDVVDDAVFELPAPVS